MPPNFKRQQGIVIVVALFIVGLVAAMSFFMLSRLSRDTQRTELILKNAQAEYYAQGSLTWAIDVLNTNLQEQKKNQIIDKFPLQSPVNTINGYRIRSFIYDLQARYNINNVITPQGQGDFLRLLQAINPKLSVEQQQDLIKAMVDWITPTILDNEYAKYYLQLPIPYRASHKNFTQVSELRLVKGMTTEIYANLEPYLVALPEQTAINIQTAPAAVLTTLSPTLNLEAARAIEQLRMQEPFISKELISNLEIIKNHGIPPEKINVFSSYFLVQTEVSIEKQTLVIYTLLQRSATQGRSRMTIIAQSKGVW